MGAGSCWVLCDGCLLLVACLLTDWLLALLVALFWVSCEACWMLFLLVSELVGLHFWCLGNLLGFIFGVLEALSDDLWMRIPSWVNYADVRN